jgi:DNA-binding response OmpR family regulator
MPKRVLDIGQCDPDHHSISRMLRDWFSVDIDRAKLWSDAEAQLTSRAYDLALVNRHLDEDYSEGVDIIRRMKSDPRFAGVPIMLVTNFPEHQAAAVAAGAAPGFGKSHLADEATRKLLSPFLS